MNCDLHCHSTVSDGTLTPTELVERAAARGIDLLALTDHDEIAGIPEAQQAAQQYGIQLVTGTEASVTWNKVTVHIVGLNFDPQNEALNAGLARTREFRTWRGEEIGRKLERATGISDALAGAKAQQREGKLLTRTHYARFLVQEKIVDSMQDAFKKYLLQGKPAHVSGQWADLEEAVNWITGAGGIAVVAHPARYNLTRTKLIRLLDEFKSYGGQGLEVVSSSHSPNEIQTMRRHAEEKELLASRGSDFHEPGLKWIDLGKIPPLPKVCRPVWEEFL